MTELFPSIIPDEDTYSATEIQNKWDYPVIRTVIAAHDTDDVNGKSTQLEMAAWCSGRFSKETIEKMMAEAKTEEPDSERIRQLAYNDGLNAHAKE